MVEYDEQKESLIIPIDRRLKEEAEKTYDRLGLDMEQAVTFMLAETVRSEELPFIETDKPYVEEEEEFKKFLLNRIENAFSEKSRPAKQVLEEMMARVNGK